MRKHFFIVAVAALFTVSSRGQQWQLQPNAQMTAWASKVTPQNVWQQYPRPQLKRNAWMNLNGLWDYSITRKNKPVPASYDGQILVPFCVESSLSGVKKPFRPEDRLYYRKEFSVPAGWKDNDVILNFDAVDWEATVWVNGVLVGSHKGAYDRFSFNITPYLKATGKQEVVVAVDDPSSSGAQARGKQQLQQQGIWYTPVSGIWQTVWLEAVSKDAWVSEVKIVPDIDKGTVRIVPISNRPLRSSYSASINVIADGKKVAEAKVAINRDVEIPLKNARLWSPEDPFLYDVHLTLSDGEGKILDKVSSYFGMRKISIGTQDGLKYTFLNNKRIFQYGTLDQGWWPDGLHTPPSEEAMVFDIIKTKEMGFNMIRKHIKVEPDLWYYHCDKAGMLVWQDMPSGMVVEQTGKEKPLHLQHVGRNGPDLYRNAEEAAQFEWELRRMIDQHYNAPSIITWVPLNEGWGQYATVRLANNVKALDSTRLVNAVSGWALRPVGDMHDIHTYQTTVDIPPAPKDRASVIGEFGGIGYPIKGHLWNPDMRNWGYQTYHSAEDLLKNYKHKFDQIVEMKRTKGLSAAVYTQTTDVEGEVNGLMTYDRKIIKIPVDVLKEIHAALKD
ncbi:glycoside hydrolase family 2 protein [Niabella insulamsoli]|uniref:glycoside hydrolase family 2 protein n=1 Tax=Niabella insulamsoli TaxID=3144874 RepID=UPI0031FDB325